MRKSKKLLMALVTLMGVVSLTSMPVMAGTNGADPKYVNEWEVEVINDDAMTGRTNLVTDEPKLNYVNEYRYRKVNVKEYTEWSAYKRVSDNLSTGSEGGSISASKSVSFSASITGNVSGIDASVGSSISSDLGYTLNVGANKRVYMAYRVSYDVEKGTREMYDIVTGKVVKSNSYTIKSPSYGEYTLINYK